MKALILSAGLGTRFRPVTEKLPKPAIPFLGIPIALYAVEYCLQLGVTEFIFNTHHLADELKNSLSPYLNQAGIKFQFVDEQPEILGSGGALKNIQHLCKDDEYIVLCNADELILLDDLSLLKSLVDETKAGNYVSGLLCMEHPEAGKRFGGVWCDDKNQIIGFGKSAPQSYDRVRHFLGLSIYSNRIFNYLPKGKESNILYDGVISALNDSHKAYCHSIPCHWHELGNQTEFLDAHEAVLKDFKSSKMSLILSALNRFAPKEFVDCLLETETPLTTSFDIKGSSKNTKAWNFLLDANLPLDDISDCERSIVINGSKQDLKSILNQIIV